MANIIRKDIAMVIYSIIQTGENTHAGGLNKGFTRSPYQLKSNIQKLSYFFCNKTFRRQAIFKLYFLKYNHKYHFYLNQKQKTI